MPIKVPDNLPAQAALADEGVLLITEGAAIHQDVRPLEIALLNLMPEKIKTETQFSRLLGATPLQIELTLVTMSSYSPKNTSAEHMLAFYQPWEEVRGRKFDGLIITGAPIETLPFQDVLYWRELTQIFDWSQSHVQETYDICWAGQAALQHFYGVPKHELPQKMFGVFPHHVRGGRDGLLRGFNDEISVPVSRHTEVRREDFPEQAGLAVLLESDEAGVCLVRDEAKRHTYMFNHLEYDTGTLANEYHRDVAAGAAIELPAYYFPDDDPAQAPVNRWRAHGSLLIGNWINDLYQSTSFELADIPHQRRRVR
ncbi:MAG: homoserine O-succinyltransferase [Alphaproteobacteria bacterium]|jgi:homoserine O-succinyltransferase|nr:homoserine O-succinyltransferase [Rhodospirillaceae bacterium]MDP6405261.1 homoserine O-succinyltransferase [Alphaproteobacteria bacterium]MDP6620875.1 homoserine O-succinyltransferase [Alphaproteobacteria bacterium]|tara:strand:- start:44 stop:979 length:936 start_codon:yes stop_codon:yes gene_type:complete